MTADVKSIPVGLCACGCGGETNLSRNTDRTLGYQKGQPKRFINGHNTNKARWGEKNPQWKGGESRTRGYVLIKDHTHHRANPSGYVLSHIAIAERVLGKPLPAQAMVHHVDGNRANNKNSNLVICQDDAYHKLLHRRSRALKACGNANYRKCQFCKGYDDPQRMYIAPNTPASYHTECHNTYKREKRSTNGK